VFPFPQTRRSPREVPTSLPGAGLGVSFSGGKESPRSPSPTAHGTAAPSTGRPKEAIRPRFRACLRMIRPLRSSAPSCASNAKGKGSWPSRRRCSGRIGTKCPRPGRPADALPKRGGGGRRWSRPWPGKRSGQPWIPPATQPSTSPAYRPCCEAAPVHRSICSRPPGTASASPIRSIRSRNPWTASADGCKGSLTFFVFGRIPLDRP
jgi:hypothetical protein